MPLYHPSHAARKETPGAFLLSPSMLPKNINQYRTALGIPSSTTVIGARVPGDAREDVNKRVWAVSDCSEQQVIVNLGQFYGNTEVTAQHIGEETIQVSFSIPIDNRPTTFVSEPEQAGERYYPHFFGAVQINALPEEYVKELLERKKGFVIWTQRDGSTKITHDSILMWRFTVDESGVVHYQEMPPPPNRGEAYDSSRKENALKEVVAENGLIGIVHQK